MLTLIPRLLLAWPALRSRRDFKLINRAVAIFAGEQLLCETIAAFKDGDKLVLCGALLILLLVLDIRSLLLCRELELSTYFQSVLDLCNMRGT